MLRLHVGDALKLRYTRTKNIYFQNERWVIILWLESKNQHYKLLSGWEFKIWHQNKKSVRGLHRLILGNIFRRRKMFHAAELKHIQHSCLIKQRKMLYIQHIHTCPALRLMSHRASPCMASLIHRSWLWSKPSGSLTEGSYGTQKHAIGVKIHKTNWVVWLQQGKSCYFFFLFSGTAVFNGSLLPHTFDWIPNSKLPFLYISSFASSSLMLGFTG